MTTVRRVYQYFVAFVSLLVLTGGLIELARILLETAVAGGGTVQRGLRQEVAWNGAFIIMGLPLWLLHWGMAARAAARDPGERAATLRRLYLYAVLGTTALIVATAAQDLLESVLRALEPETAAAGARRFVAPIPRLVVAAALWLYHYRVVADDRRAVGETGGGATLRRWYTYATAFIALTVLLLDAAQVFRLTWETVAGALTGSIAGRQLYGMAGSAATAQVALAFWVAHWRLAVVAPGDQEVAAQDARSTLRPVYLFLALALSVAVTLSGAAQLLYYLMARALGVPDPGGVTRHVAVAMAGPVSWVVVFGTSWLYQQRALAAQERAQRELPRQAGVRRLYVYLVALLALAVLAAGTGGLLWTLADLATNAPHRVQGADWWRENVSRYVTLLIVGLPVWARHWGPLARPPAGSDETRSLARRLYVYIALLAAVLTLLGAGVTAVWQILNWLLGEAATPAAITNLARALAVSAVAGAVIYYHQRVLRLDLGDAPVPAAEEPAAEEPAAADPAAASPPEGGGATTPSVLRPYGLVYRRAGVERSAWYATAPQARTAEQELPRPATPADWSIVVVADASALRVAAPPPEPAG